MNAACPEVDVAPREVAALHLHDLKMRLVWSRGGADVFVKERSRRWSLLKPSYKRFLCERAGVPDAAEKAFLDMTKEERFAIYHQRWKMEQMVAALKDAF